MEVDNGYDAFSLDNDRFTRSDEPGEDDQETTFFSLSMDRKIGESVAAEISGGWANSNITYGYDEGTGRLRVLILGNIVPQILINAASIQSLIKFV